MHSSTTFNKMAPATENPIFLVSGSNPNGFVLSIQNQDAIGTLVYKMQESNDGGGTWENLEFPVIGSPDPASTFTVVAGAAQSLKVTSTAPLIRMVGYGDVAVAISLLSFRSTPTAAGSPVSLVI